MKKIFITALLLASAGTAQAATEPCNPATGNWINAAPTTCRFISRGNLQPAAERPVLRTPVREVPPDDVPPDVPELF